MLMEVILAKKELIISVYNKLINNMNNFHFRLREFDVYLFPIIVIYIIVKLIVH